MDDITAGRVGIGIALLVAIIAVGFGANEIWLQYRVHQESMVTQGNRQTEQYRASKETLLLDKLAQATSIDAKIIQFRGQADAVAAYEAQRNALLVQMHTEAARLRPEQVPPAVADYLRANPAPIRD